MNHGPRPVVPLKACKRIDVDIDAGQDLDGPTDGTHGLRDAERQSTDAGEEVKNSNGRARDSGLRKPRTREE